MRIEDINYSVNLSESVLWQYNTATNFLNLIGYKQAWYDLNQTGFWTDWFNNVFNLITANDFGLVVWAIILNVPTYYNPNFDPDQPTWGFNKYTSFPTLENNYVNFGNGNFSAQGSAIILSTEYRRLILRLRFYQLITDGVVTDINNFFATLFKINGTPFNGTAYVLDGLDMSMTYVFNFYMPKILRKLIAQLDLLPRPAGVRLKYISQPGTFFGFGSSNKNFNNGGFAPEDFF